MPQEPNKNRNTSFYKYTSMAGKMIAVILAGTFGGRWIDSKVSIEFPVFTLVLTIASVGLAMYVAIRDLSK